MTKRTYGATDPRGLVGVAARMWGTLDVGGVTVIAPDRAMMLMAGLAAAAGAGLGLGLLDWTLPLATGGALFGTVRAPETFLDLLLLGMRAFAHNWGLALVVPAVGGIAVHFEPRVRLVAGILAASVAVGCVLSFAMVPPPAPRSLAQFLLLVLEVEGVLVGAFLGAQAVAHGRRERSLRATCQLQLRNSAHAVLVPLLVLALAAALEIMILAA
ncbi:MAG TPA: hypothetical protein VGR28_06890 [Candidatus Thermoplasmatota archaeon]|nr:hypothetical protein [Candidatus Thermoplasmatota archaeon]